MATQVDCPHCGRRTEFGPRNPWRPFCSERCKTGDLGAWASNAYVIEGASDEATGADDDEAQARGERRRDD